MMSDGDFALRSVGFNEPFDRDMDIVNGINVLAVYSADGTVSKAAPPVL
jgi:hypothetical protein